MSTALILTGCGARGAWQQALLRAVVDSQIPFDMVFGCSAGSLNGSLLIQNEIDLLEKVWLEISSSKVYHSNPLTWAGAVIGKASIYSPAPLRRLLSQVASLEKQKVNKTPFYVIATDITTREPVVKQTQLFDSQQELEVFLLGSASPPIMFPPARFAGHALVDAGISNNFAISNAIAAGADTLIILRPQPKYIEKPKNLVEMVGLTIGIATEGYLERELSFVNRLNAINDEQYRDVKVVLVTCPNFGVDLLDFDYKGLDRKTVMQHVYNLGRNQLDKAFA